MNNEIKKDSGFVGEEHLDLLKEVGNIGAGNATTALAQILNGKVDMEVPKVKILEFSELSDILGGPDTQIIGILFGLSRDIKGTMMFVLSVESAKMLISILLGQQPSGDELSEMEMSTLKEIGNIISGAYVYSLSELCNMTIWTSVPYIAKDMAGAILSVPAMEIAKTADKALIIETLFVDGINKIDGYFILIPEEESYLEILNKLGVR